MKNKSKEDIVILASLINGILFVLYNSFWGYNKIFQKVELLGAYDYAAEVIVNNYSVIISGFIRGFGTLFISFVLINLLFKKIPKEYQDLVTVGFASLFLVLIHLKTKPWEYVYMVKDLFLIFINSALFSYLAILIARFIQDKVGDKK
jgi:hypothetical protein